VVRPITNEKDYNEALERIEQLMDAEPGTEDGDLLAVLATLVELYEEERFPVELPDPVEAIKFRMEQAGLKQKDLVPFIGSKSKVSEVLNRKRPLSLTMMRSLHKGLGIPAEVLLRSPGQEFPETWPDIEWGKFPLSTMAKRGWISVTKNLKGCAEEVVRGFINRAGGLEAIPRASFRRGIRNRTADDYALLSWCIRVLTVAREKPLPTSSKPSVVNKAFLRRVAKFSYLEGGPRLAKEYLAKRGIHLIVVAQLPRTRLDGAAMLTQDGIPVVGLTLRFDRVDNFWFCLLHELAHVGRHLARNDNDLFIDDLQDEIRRTTSDLEEMEANEWAQEALIPMSAWIKHPVSNDPTATNVLDLAERLEIHPAIVAGRARFEQNNYRILPHFVGQGEVRKHFENEYPN
jgi:HTH-type transcriptional regulator/antitoxin HigA